MTQTQKNNWFGGLKYPWIKDTQEVDVSNIINELVPTIDLPYAQRDYQAAVLLQAGAAAVLEWRTPLVKAGVVEVYESITVLLAAGSAATSFRLFISVHGVPAGGSTDIIQSRMALAAAHEVDFLALTGDTAPEAHKVGPIVVPANCHILVDTTAPAAAGTDATMKFLRYRMPGPPSINQVEDVSAALTT